MRFRRAGLQLTVEDSTQMVKKHNVAEECSRVPTLTSLEVGKYMHHATDEHEAPPYGILARIS